MWCLWRRLCVTLAPLAEEDLVPGHVRVGSPEKWNSGIAGGARLPWRGEFVGVMPGRTRWWKEFHGLAFNWVLGEAVGAGRVEILRRGV